MVNRCYFYYAHLPEHLQTISIEFYKLMNLMDDMLMDSTEKEAGARKLLEAKDCFVRAHMNLID
jgi:hypothetical protein